MNALFEGFNTDDYYTSISSDTAFKLIGHLKNKFENTKTLTDKEILILSSLYSNIEINHKNHEIDISISSGDDGILNIVLSHKNVYTETLQYQNIVKLDDDWFILIHSIKGTGLVYFKCDQLDGLIKCIEDHKMKFPD
jgi:hypothetical protein